MNHSVTHSFTQDGSYSRTLRYVFLGIEPTAFTSMESVDRHHNLINGALLKTCPACSLPRGLSVPLHFKPVHSRMASCARAPMKADAPSSWKTAPLVGHRVFHPPGFLQNSATQRRCCSMLFIGVRSILADSFLGNV